MVSRCNVSVVLNVVVRKIRVIFTYHLSLWPQPAYASIYFTFHYFTLGEDTDLGPPFRDLYKTLCDKNGCNPTSYFLRHIDEKEVHMKHHGLTRHESCALAEVLRVCDEQMSVRNP